LADTNPGTTTNPGSNINSTLDYRRQERTEQLLHEQAGRIGEMTTVGLEIYQKQIAFSAALLHFWGDTLHGMQNSVGQMISQSHRVTEQTRRAG
jgi:hypothetical protein